MDRFAHRAANLLIGNAETDATLECTLSGPHLLAERAFVIAITGADFEPRINGAQVATWTGIFMSAGVTVTPARIALTLMPVPLRASSIASWRQCDSSAAFAADTAPYVGTTRVEPSEVIA